MVKQARVLRMMQKNCIGLKKTQVETDIRFQKS